MIYTQELIEEVKEQVNLQELVEELTGEGVDGAGKLCCFFHEEDTPSLSINEEFFNCFGCGEKGDVIRFLMKYKNLSFEKSVEYLINRQDATVPTIKRSATMAGKSPRKSEKRKAISRQENDDIIGRTSKRGELYRGIGDRALVLAGCRTEFDHSGAGSKVIARYYPVTEKFNLVGYKKRICDKDVLSKRGKKKDFTSIGRNSAESDLYGAYHHRNGGRTALIVGGEEDKHASDHIIHQEFEKKGWTPPVVLSPTVGESSCLKQVQHNYNYLNKFDEVVVALDADEAGREATKGLLESLPKGKAWTIEWRYKDPNTYIEKGASKEFVDDYWRKKKYLPVGIIPSNELYESVVEEISRPKIPLPPFMSQLEKMTAGGFPIGVIVNIAADSGSGKTTIVNEILYYWYFNSPYLSLTVSLELNKGQYGEAIFSRHLGVGLKSMASISETKKVLENNKDKLRELEVDEQGNPRFILIDDRDGSLDDLKQKIEEAIVVLGVKVIALDPLNDLFEGLDLREQEEFLRWQKRTVKSRSVTFINICHLNKAGQGRFFNEEGKLTWPQGDLMHGSSSILKSGAVNILTARNKESDTDQDRNTTHVMLKKNRVTGKTGNCGLWYYDPDSHTLHDKETFFNQIEAC